MGDGAHWAHNQPPPEGFDGIEDAPDDHQDELAHDHEELDPTDESDYEGLTDAEE